MSTEYQCKHESQIKIPTKSSYSLTFCDNCGKLLISYPSSLSAPSEQIELQTNTKSHIKYSFSQKIQTIEQMKITQAQQLKKFSSKPSYWYLKNRERMLCYIKKLTLKLDYSDSSFYYSLLFIDKLLKNIENDSILDEKEHDYDYLIISIYLAISKFYEDDTYEPDFGTFYDMTGKEKLDSSTIKRNEMAFLQKINYDIIDYSALDWLNVFMDLGFIFKGELDNRKFDLNDVYNKVKVLLAKITNRSLFVEFSPFQIAISIIHYARERYKLNTRDSKYSKMDIIQSLYKVTFEDYCDCYEKICSVFGKKSKSVHQVKEPINELILSEKQIEMKKESKDESIILNIDSPKNENEEDAKLIRSDTKDSTAESTSVSIHNSDKDVASFLRTENNNTGLQPLENYVYNEKLLKNKLSKDKNNCSQLINGDKLPLIFENKTKNKKMENKNTKLKIISVDKSNYDEETGYKVNYTTANISKNMNVNTEGNEGNNNDLMIVKLQSKKQTLMLSKEKTLFNNQMIKSKVNNFENVLLTTDNDSSKILDKNPKIQIICPNNNEMPLINKSINNNNAALKNLIKIASRNGVNSQSKEKNLIKTKHTINCKKSVFCNENKKHVVHKFESTKNISKFCI